MIRLFRIVRAGHSLYLKLQRESRQAKPKNWNLASQQFSSLAESANMQREVRATALNLTKKKKNVSFSTSLPNTPARSAAYLVPLCNSYCSCFATRTPTPEQHTLLAPAELRSALRRLLWCSQHTGKDFRSSAVKWRVSLSGGGRRADSTPYRSDV